jgi:UDP-N-acetylmuramoyl-tripeptide--D-alanyl-D-alanine ligase
VDRLYALGPHAEAVARAARDAGSAHAEAVETHDAIARDIAAHARPDSAVLVKGSRGMRMENVISALRALVEN